MHVSVSACICVCVCVCRSSKRKSVAFGVRARYCGEIFADILF